MNCPKVQLLLSDYLDGELTVERAEAVEHHLEACAQCTHLWKELRGTVRMVGHLGRQRCPVDLRSAVMQSIVHTPARPAATLLARRFLVALAGGSAVLGTLALSLLPHSSIWLSDTGMKQGRTAAQSLPVPVHVQYNMATSLGTADGLMLSLPTAPEVAGHELRNPVQR